MPNVQALMEGQRIKLEDRKTCTLNRFLSIKRDDGYDDDSSEDDCEVCMNKYRFQYTSKTKHPNLKTQNRLAIKQLELPLIPSLINNHIKTPSKQHTLKKRRSKLGLKPIKPLSVKKSNETSNNNVFANCKTQPGNNSSCSSVYDDGDAEEEIDIEGDADEQSSPSRRFIKHVNYDINDVDFDFDVLRLIMHAECNNSMPSPSMELVGDRDAAAIVEDNGGNNKKIRFALSKPASPRTLQVIRVDVTASTSACNRARNNTRRHQDNSIQQQRGRQDTDDNYYGRFRRDYSSNERPHKCYNRSKCKCNCCYKDLFEYSSTKIEKNTPDFTLMCKKLTLSAK